MKRIKSGFLLLLCLTLILVQPAFADLGTEETSAVSTEGMNLLILYDQDGTEYTRITSSKKKFSLPSMASKEGYTFLGWSKKKGTGKDPDYEAGDKVTVSGTLRLYAVFFKLSKEADRDVSGLSSGYDKVIFVGDSRTVGLESALKQEYGKNGIKNVSFVAKSGTGIVWLKNSGIAQVRKLVRQELKKNKNARIAVIFNHGVNNLKHKDGASVDVSAVVEKYASFMKKVAKELKKSGCDLYYLSVNPVNSGKSDTMTLRRGEELRSFNAKLKKKLKGQYTFIDCYSYLVKNGYSTQTAPDAELVEAESNYRDDGVHYSSKTYKRIYAYCMKALKAGYRS